MLCVAGVGLVSLNGDLTITIGDLLTLVSALFYALHIVAVNKLSPGKDVYLITVFQFAGTAILSLISAALFQPFPAAIFSQAQVLLPLLYLCVVYSAYCSRCCSTATRSLPVCWPALH